MSPAERLAVVEGALMRAHALSRAITFMVLAESEPSGAILRASLEEVSHCTNKAIQLAINNAKLLAQDFKQA